MHDPSSENADQSLQADAPLNGAQAWTAYLAGRPLPTRHSSLQRLKRETASDGGTLKSITAAIKADPVLCVHVVRQAQALHASKGSDVTGIDHAIGSLGMERLGQLAADCQALRLHPGCGAELQYFHAVASSHHAATQCAQWLRVRHATYAEKGWVAALCYGLGNWSLWRHAPLHMDRINRRILDAGLDPIEAQTETLGCSIQQISSGLAQAWQLPPLVLAALDDDTSPSGRTLDRLHQRSLSDPHLSRDELRSLSHLLQQHFFPVKLANWLVETTQFGWGTTRARSMYDIVNDFLGKELHDTSALIHQNCALAAQQYHVPGTLAPAAEMLFTGAGQPSHRTLDDAELQRYSGAFPEPPPLPEPPVAAVRQPATFADAQAYQQISNRLQQGYSLYTRPAHILQGLLLGLSQGLGLQRLALQLVRSKQQLKTAQVIGIDDDDPITELQADLDSSVLLKQLCSRPGCIWLSTSTRPRLLPMLPPAYRQALGQQDSLMMCIFAHDKPVALVYGDLGSPQAELESFHRDQFRALCAAASQALDRMLSQT
ncbi:HDOD domain-containing protein [Marinobacterium rhizophilum]|uniref:HDOD domain-containing protein n=1 Tax=Marinobacterium rhizophilum TaxID=420402 RepID=A0ABY5HLF6_9GAMM|nr:HDOD domain-containing protein [Marinobacterium rhizophilum]UTW11766.1 HDOD domain-containing protein [Marinobacterium rhizophilum]